MKANAIGIIEGDSYGFITAGLDAMLKEANVKVVKYEVVGGMWLAAYVAGDINAVQAAVSKALATAKQIPSIHSRGVVISNPAPEFLRLYDL